MFQSFAAITAVLILLSVLAGCSSTSRGSDNSRVPDKVSLPTEVGETVTLTYVAVPDVTAHVDYYNETINIKDGIETVEETNSGSSRLRSSAHPDGILWREDQRVFDLEIKNPKVQKHLAPALEALSSIETKSVVSDTGELLKFEGMEPVSELVKQSFNDMLATSREEARPIFEAIGESLLTEEELFRNEQETWVLTVSDWVGAELEKGYIYETNYSETFPELGNVEVGFDAIYEYHGKADCNEDDKAASCVELSYRTTIKPEHAESATKALVEKLNFPTEADAVFLQDFSTILITDPLTLRPYQFDTVERARVADSEEPGWIDKIRRESFVYTYE